MRRLGNWGTVLKNTSPHSQVNIPRGEERGDTAVFADTNFDAKLKNPPDDDGQGVPKQGIFKISFHSPDLTLVSLQCGEAPKTTEWLCISCLLATPKEDENNTKSIYQNYLILLKLSVMGDFIVLGPDFFG